MKYLVCRRSLFLATSLGVSVALPRLAQADAAATATAIPTAKAAAAPVLASTPAATPTTAAVPVVATTPSAPVPEPSAPVPAPAAPTTKPAVTAAPPPASGTAPPKAREGKVGLTPEQKLWARRRFDRGLELYDAGDFAGALKEFQAALLVARHPIVLYNVALVFARLGSPVECVKSVEELKQSGLETLDPNSRERLTQVYDEQRSRIGRLQVRSNVDGALIQIDGVDIGQHEVLDLPLAAGDHVVSTIASGYIPRRLRVFITPQGQENVNLTLQPLQSTLAHLEILSDVPDVEVTVDGDPIGHTPFPASLAFSPGPHQVTAKRAGYTEIKQNVLLDPGGAGHLNFQMQLDESSPAGRGTLTLAISEPNSFITVNGKALGIGRERLQLPVGRHRLSVHSAGFTDYERDVTVEPGEHTTRIELMPTSEFLTDYQASAERQRLAGWISVGAGAVVAAAGVGFLVWNGGEKSRARDAHDEFAAQVANSVAGECSSPACADTLASREKRVQDTKNRDIWGWVGVGVGAAAAAVGGGLLIWGPDPARYAPRRESDVFGSLQFRVGPGSAALFGRF